MGDWIGNGVEWGEKSFRKIREPFLSHVLNHKRHPIDWWGGQLEATISGLEGTGDVLG